MLQNSWKNTCVEWHGRLGRNAFLLDAVLLAIVYVASLHPSTGFIGGVIFYFLASWVFPTAIVVLLSLWCASFAKRSAVRVVVFIIVSTLLGLNTKIPVIIAQKQAVPETEWRVDRGIRPHKRETYIKVPDSNERHAIVNPSMSMPSIGGDEGCGCFYFVLKKELQYSYTLKKQLRLYAPWAVYSLEELKENPPFFTYSEELAEGGATATVSFYVYDEAGVSGYFIQKNLPVFSFTPSRSNLRGPDFYKYAKMMLMHDNVWVALTSSVLPSYFDLEAFKSFRKEAILPGH